MALTTACGICSPCLFSTVSPTYRGTSLIIIYSNVIFKQRLHVNVSGRNNSINKSALASVDMYVEVKTCRKARYERVLLHCLRFQVLNTRQQGCPLAIPSIAGFSHGDTCVELF
jgi:hypothetical protein